MIMIFLSIITGLIIIFLIIQCIRWDSEGRETYGFGIFCGWVMASLFVIEIIWIYGSVFEPYPKAIDVYRGQTTLEITYRDSVALDSIVIWKDE